MKIDGHNFDAEPITVRELLEEIEKLRQRDPALLDRPIHFLAMEETAASGYVTRVDLDCFDITEADPDDEGCQPIVSLCLYHHVSGPNPIGLLGAAGAAQNSRSVTDPQDPQEHRAAAFVGRIVAPTEWQWCEKCGWPLAAIPSCSRCDS